MMYAPVTNDDLHSDCGEGTQRQLFLPHVHADTKLSHIRYILITHPHQDRMLDSVD